MKLGYTIIYVQDVLATVIFYERAFNLKRRFIHESNLYAELETGQTTLAFAGNEAAKMNGLDISPNKLGNPPAGWEICLVTDQVKTAYDHAITNGCLCVVAPCKKPWGQTVSYVLDVNGCLVEIASPIQKS